MLFILEIKSCKRQAAIDEIRETAKSRHIQMQQSLGKMDIEEFREKMKSAHRGP